MAGGLSIHEGGGLSIHEGAARETFWFYQDNVAISQTAVALKIQGDAVRVDHLMIRPGSVTGISIYSNEARTASTCIVDPTIDGTVTGLTATLDGTNTTEDAATQVEGLDTFTAKQLIGCKVTTTGTWAPQTADILVGVEVTYE